MYAPDAPYTVYCPKCWWSDDWDPFEYGRDYDFSRPFFGQFNELWHKVPLLGLSLDIPTSLSSPYTNHAGQLKNCYLIFHADSDEDCLHGFQVVNCKNTLDSSLIGSSELCYDSIHSFKNYNSVGLSHASSSVNCAFLRDGAGCQNCFASADLKNKSHYIFNKPYTKEDYQQEIKKWDLGSYKTYQELKKLAYEHWKKFPPKPCWDEFSSNVTGNYVFESKNCKECFEVTGAQDSKYIFLTTSKPIKDSYDISSWGNNMSLSYECCNVGENVSGVKFCQESGTNLYNAEYCKLSIGGQNHFGCVSIKKGEYCILNKRYSETDFYGLRKKIIAHMNEMPYISQRANGKEQIVYKYGEFFPTELSPFGYNETIAQNFFPLSKDEIIDNGYLWRELEKREYAITKKPTELPDHIKDTTDDILKEIVGCGSCERGFRIVPAELQLLRRMNLPLPRECPFCRIDAKFKQWVKNLRLFKRKCDKCGVEFETSSSKSETPYILCKKCYLDEVV